DFREGKQNQEGSVLFLLAPSSSSAVEAREGDGRRGRQQGSCAAGAGTAGGGRGRRRTGRTAPEGRGLAAGRGQRRRSGAACTPDDSKCWTRPGRTPTVLGAVEAGCWGCSDR